MLAMAMMLAAAATDRPIPRESIRFSRAPALAHASDTVDIATAARGPNHPAAITVRLTRRRLGKVVAVLVTDGDACPAARETIASIRQLAVPAVAVPGEDGDIVLDGTAYAFEGTTRGPGTGHIAFWVTDGPFARWVDARLAALAPCWKPAKS